MTNHAQGNGSTEEQADARRGGLSWRGMLVLLALAIVAAAAIAYLLVDPFFHQPPR